MIIYSYLNESRKQRKKSHKVFLKERRKLKAIIRNGNGIVTTANKLQKLIYLMNHPSYEVRVSEDDSRLVLIEIHRKHALTGKSLRVVTCVDDELNKL